MDDLANFLLLREVVQVVEVVEAVEVVEGVESSWGSWSSWSSQSSLWVQYCLPPRWITWAKALAEDLRAFREESAT